MGKSGSELLLYGLIIAGFLLFNYLARRLAQKAREQQETAPQAETAEDDVLEDVWGRAPAVQPVAMRVPEQRTPAPVAAPPLGPPAATRHRLFRTRQDLRRAIVLMTVLGPCRALEPHERR